MAEIPAPKASTEPRPPASTTKEVPPPLDTSTAVPTAPAPSAPPTKTHQNEAVTSVDAAPSPDTALASRTYALNLSTSTIDEEMEKRKKRAERFGTAPSASETGAVGTEQEDDEAMKALERAKRFGIG